MLTDPESTATGGGWPDPATPERRAELARSLLISAIRRYDEAVLAHAAVFESYPNLDRPRAPADEAEVEERRAWQKLKREVDDDFDAVEFALADRIQGLYDLLAPEGRRAGSDPGSYFVPRAVRHGGYVYVLADNVGMYEPRANFVAVYQESMVVDLDDAGRGSGTGILEAGP